MTSGAPWRLPATDPIVLLPVRLETRWRSDDTLAIRIIPDTIHADTFEQGLTDAERTAGQAYWAQVRTDSGLASGSWQLLTDRFSVPRAAWIARSTRAGADPGTRAASWTRPAHAVALPSRWHAFARLSDETVAVTGTPLSPGPVTIGLDPADPGSGLPAWMTDFDAAVSAGLGLVLPLGPAMIAQRRLDLLVVYGVDESGDPVANAARLTDLLDAHYYTDGFGYLSPGTPTNNSDRSDSGHAPSSETYRSAYQVQAADPVLDPDGTAAARVADLLGLPVRNETVPTDRPAHAILLADGAHTREDATARAMTSATWAATWGYFLGHILAPDQGEDARRLDHRNLVARNAYLRSLDRQRLWPAAQRNVIFDATGADPGEPGSPGVATAWQGLIRALVIGDPQLSTEQATAQLILRVDQNLTVLWQQRTGDAGTPLDDWLAADSSLEHDRTAAFAYFRWLNRVSRGGPASDSRLEDWLAGEAAATYGPVTVRAARAHAVAHLRPGGHLPTFAVGRQPYGILLTTALDRWRPNETDHDLVHFVAALRALRDTVWLPAAQAMPRLGTDDLDVDAANRALLDVMGAAPISSDVFARAQLGPDYLRNLWRFARPGLREDWESVTATRSEALLHDIGIAWVPRASRMVGAETSALVGAPPVTALGISTPSWIATLADPATTIDQLIRQADLPGVATPLLYRLLRHAALREFADAAVALRFERGLLDDWEHLDQELIGIRPGTPAATVWSTLRTQLVDTPDGMMSVADALESGQAGAATHGLDEFRAAAAELARADDDTLARHLMQSLDSTSHRLDAWITSIAARRLAAQRADTRSAGAPDGCLIGGYAWVIDLRAADPADADLGFVHAPSIPQAVTAAVLRSGYDVHTGGSANPFAVDLDSRRVRTATELLDTVRSGQPPGTALGYLFERRLQTTPAGQYVLAFRTIAPTPATAVDPESANASATTWQTSVVDGLELNRLQRGAAVSLTRLLDRIASDDAARPPGEQPVLPLVTDAIAMVGDIVDATSDALTAEAVHHMVNGAPTRAAATLDLLAHGDGSVPELESMRTPRHGTAITHRVAVVLSADTSPRAGWPAVTESPRAAASPLLEMLLQQLLPDPRAVEVQAHVVTSGKTDEDQAQVTVSLADARISAVDCVLSVSAAPEANGEQPSELLAAAFATAARSAVGESQMFPVTVDLRLPPGSTGPALVDVIRLFRLVADLLHRCRPLTSADLATPGSATTKAPDLSDLAKAACTAVDIAFADVCATSADVQRAGLRAAARLGVMGAAAAGDAVVLDPGAVDSTAAELIVRRQAVAALPADAAEARIHAALGAGLPVLSAIDPSDPLSLAAARAAADRPGFASPVAIRGWVAASATVRDPVATLRRALTGRLALRLPRGVLRTLQLPPPDGTEPWIGGGLGGFELAGPRTQVTYVELCGTDFGHDVAGLLVDQWSETIPARTATTGLAYRFPSPTSQPPQSVLVAVHPDPSQTMWDSNTLEAVLLETVDLAAVRAVDPDALNDTGQLLPAAYLAFNPNDPPDTVSTVLVPPAQPLLEE